LSFVPNAYLHESVSSAKIVWLNSTQLGLDSYMIKNIQFASYMKYDNNNFRAELCECFFKFHLTTWNDCESVYF